MNPGRQRAQRTPAPPANQHTLESVCARVHRRCILCGVTNRRGLRLRFEVQPDGSVAAPFRCCDALQSYPGTLHGGLVSALLDAAMTNVLFSVGIVAVTAELTVRFLAPVRLRNRGVVRAWITATSRLLYQVRAEIEQGGVVVARASAKFLARSA